MHPAVAVGAEGDRIAYCIRSAFGWLVNVKAFDVWAIICMKWSRLATKMEVSFGWPSNQSRDRFIPNESHRIYFWAAGVSLSRELGEPVQILAAAFLKLPARRRGNTL